MAVYIYNMNTLHIRQSYMENHLPYFYTLTVENFKHLLADDYMKSIIIESWQYLVNERLVEIYGYVIMPNHLHLIWRMMGSNGKETPAGSFAKYTAHRFLKHLEKHNPVALSFYTSDKRDRKHQFWKRDPLAIPITRDSILTQKLEYIHNNPVREKWNLSIYPEDYRWSSARYYTDGVDEFGIVTHFRDMS